MCLLICEHIFVISLLIVELFTDSVTICCSFDDDLPSDVSRSVISVDVDTIDTTEQSKNKASLIIFMSDKQQSTGTPVQELLINKKSSIFKCLPLAMID